MAFDDLPTSDPTPTTPALPSLETRNVLNHASNIIGQLSLLTGTAESIWTTVLSNYASAASTPPAQVLINVSNMTATSNITTSSASMSTLGSMTVTPGAGSYLVFFSGNIATSGASATGEFGIHVNGVLVNETRRDIKCNLTLLGGLVSISLNSIGVGTYTGTQITVDSDDVIDVRYRSTNGGTIAFSERTLSLLKVT